MNQIAFIFNHITLYRYSVVLALAAVFGVCFFLACCAYRKLPSHWAAAAALLGVLFSLVFSRLIFWYCRPFSFETFRQALTTPATASHALLGAFVGCLLAAAIIGRYSGEFLSLLDCISTAGCGAIALGRLAFFFSDADRGRVLTGTTSLPWAYPILDPGSGQPEYRLATFLFQSAAAGVLFLVLALLFFRENPRHRRKSGSLTALFLMVYCASQVILDSTRYDSLYLHSNGFVSMIQVLSAITLALTIVVCSVRAVKARGIKKWMYLPWVLVPCLFGGAGYMEYFVQRHGKLAAMGYSVMGACLAGIVLLGVLLWRAGMAPNLQKEHK